MQCASTSTYPENLGRGGLLPAELGGRICLFFVVLFVCLSITLRRQAQKAQTVRISIELGGNGRKHPDNFSYRSNFRFSYRSSSSYTTSGDIFYCSGSRQLNHSSLLLFCLFSAVCLMLVDLADRNSSLCNDYSDVCVGGPLVAGGDCVVTCMINSKDKQLASCSLRASRARVDHMRAA